MEYFVCLNVDIKKDIIIFQDKNRNSTIMMTSSKSRYDRHVSL